MIDKSMKNLAIFFMSVLVFTAVFSFSLPALAATVTGWGNASDKADATAVQGNVGLGDTDPRAMAASVINVILGFLGIIAVVIILLGGFKWMTAGGNEDKVGEAKKLITAGVIGLVIILASWAIATFVVSSLLGATGVTESGTAGDAQTPDTGIR